MGIIDRTMGIVEEVLKDKIQINEGKYLFILELREAIKTNRVQNDLSLQAFLDEAILQIEQRTSELEAELTRSRVESLKEQLRNDRQGTHQRA